MNRNYTRYSGSEIVEQGKYEVTWQQVRKERDQALADSDWRFMSDQSPLDEWVDYRQALRDLPQDNDTANDAADHWPTPPE